MRTSILLIRPLLTSEAMFLKEFFTIKAAKSGTLVVKVPPAHNNRLISSRRRRRPTPATQISPCLILPFIPLQWVLSWRVRNSSHHQDLRKLNLPLFRVFEHWENRCMEKPVNLNVYLFFFVRISIMILCYGPLNIIFTGLVWPFFSCSFDVEGFVL